MTPGTRAQLIEVAARAAAREGLIDEHEGNGGLVSYQVDAVARVLDAVLAHRESIVCPTCSTWSKQFQGHTNQCPRADCSDGFILGPTVLVERAEYAQVGITVDCDDDFLTVEMGDTDLTPFALEPVFVLRSSNQSETP